MARATKLRDEAHVRIYRKWLAKPAWRTLSPIAKVGLVEVLGRYHPDRNPLVQLSVRDLADILDSSKTTAATVFWQLEDRGWIMPVERSRFTKPLPTTYRLTMFRDPASNEPPSREFETWEPLLRSAPGGR